LSEFDSDNLVLDKNIADFYEDGVNSDPSFGSVEYKQYCNWLMNDISRMLNKQNKTIKDTKLHPHQVVDLINHIKEGKITTKIAKTFIGEMVDGISIFKLVEKKGKKRISDEEIIEKACYESIKENPKIVEDSRTNPKAIEALIGKVMGKTKGQADPGITRRILERLLHETKNNG
jgi:aspartyl-tRNA(Asn)/glutamyl-tRNA(Gln) amidotransferase subunit B